MSKIIILSGAGVSAESGISTFRESGGLWDNYDVNIVCNHDSLDKNESLTLEFYDKRRDDIKDKVPNNTHIIIKELKQKYPNDISVITQNVDNLFEKAGMNDDEVIHLHGFMTQVRCREDQCARIYNIEYESIKDCNNGICDDCGSKLRPNIVFFGEMAPMYEKLNEELTDCEMFIVIGTSGNVIGVNTLANFVDYSILNNLEPSDAIEESLFSKVLYKKSSIAINEIAEDIEEFLNSSS
ncbi:MAG: NAD-dependent deacetylase [Campylobacteraceae bacterium]|nr:NAD-dependent deacetylase [Campylobacteraceae bacterium]MBT4572435.1 NAD-dependent deacetylase [Campylobacteraceae bacterium]